MNLYFIMYNSRPFLAAKVLNTIRKLRAKHRKESAATLDVESKLLKSSNRLESAITIEENLSSSDCDSEHSGLQMNK